MTLRRRVLILDALRVILSSFLAALLVLPAPEFLMPAVAAQSVTQVTLQQSTVPSSAEPGVTYVNLTGTNFPSGTIAPTSITVTLAPAVSGPAMTATVKSVTTLVGTSRRITFQVSPGNSVASPTPYLVTVSGTTSQGLSFVSANTSSLTINPPAKIALNPSSGQPGQTLAVTINGKFTNFFQEATFASFGPGISVGGAAQGALGPVSVTGATSAIAQLQIDPAASGGSRDVTAKTGAEIAFLAGGFSVKTSTPMLTIVNPGNGQQGQTNESVNLTGQFTHWVQGTTTASFGAGITVATLTVNSATSATVVLNIDPAAAPGARIVTVTTAAEVVTLNNGFAVTNGTPVLTTVSPNTGQQGQTNESVNLTGQFTHWVQGTTTASFGAGVTVATLSVNSATSATAMLNIDPAAASGARNVSVTTGGEVVALTNGFTVTGGATLVSISPNSGIQGQVNLPVTITGQNTHFTNASVIDLGSGITVGGVSATDATHLSAGLTIAGGVNLVQNGSLEDLTGTFVNTSGNYMALGAGSTAIAGWTIAPPTTNSIVWGKTPTSDSHTASDGTFFVDLSGFGSNSPNGAIQQQLKNLTVGQQYTFSMDTLVVGQLPLVTVGAATVTLWAGTPFLAGSDTWTPQVGTFIAGSTNPLLTIANQNPGQQIYFIDHIVVTGPTTVALGLHNLTVATGQETATLNNAFTVNAPVCTSPPPGLVSWWAGDGNTSDLLGANNPSTSNAVNFVPGEVGAGFAFGSGGYIDIPPSATLANQQFTLSAWVRPDGPGPTNDFDGSVIFEQNRDNTTTLSLTWRATDNHFLFFFGDVFSEFVSSQDSFGPGQFYLVTGTYDGATFKLYINGTLEAQMVKAKTIAYSTNTWTIGAASPNIRSQGFPRTWNGVIDEVQAFSRALSQAEIQGIYSAGNVGECRGPTVISSVVPDSGQQGQQNLSVAITGQFTNFVQGITTATFGPGVTAASLTVNSATNATAVVNIDPAATIGARDVILTTGAEVATRSNGFSVTTGTTTGTPVLTQVSPNAGQQGQQNLSVAITGEFTHFVQGTTTASFGTGITVASLTVNSATSATAVLNIDPAAALGSRNVTVTTGAEVVTLTNGFTVDVGTPSLSVNAGPNQTISQNWDLLVPNYRNPPYDVLRYDGETGAFLNSFASGTAAGILAPGFISYGPDGNIYVDSGDIQHAGSLAFEKISRFDGTSGGFIDTFVPQGSGGTFTFGPDGNLYLVNGYTDNVIKRFDGRNGTFLGPFAGGLISSDVDYPGEVWTNAQKINDSGQIVGYYRDSSRNYHGFLLSGGTYSAIGCPSPYIGSVAVGINNLGQIVGYCYAPGGVNGSYGSSRSFIVSGGVLSFLPDAPGSYGGASTFAEGINDNGQIVGWYADSCLCKGHGFLLSGGIYTTVDVPGFGATYPFGINNHGEIVGFTSSTFGGGSPQGFTLINGTYTSFNDPAAVTTSGTYAEGIDDSGQVVGFYGDNNNVEHGFLLNAGVFTNIDHPNAQLTQALGINSQGQIVGVYSDPANVLHGFVTGATPPSNFTFARGLAFGPDGELYVADTDRIVKIDGQTGANLGSFTTPGAGGLAQATDLVFGPDGDLYVSQLDIGNVLHFDGRTGAFRSVFVASGSGAQLRMSPVAFGPDSKFYVGSLPGNNGNPAGGVYRFDGKTGAFVDYFVPNGSGGLFDVSGFMFRFRAITTNLSGSVAAQFLPGPTVTSWSQVSGPGTVTFANASSPNTLATFSVPGTYVLRLSASASGLATSSDVTITATTPNQPPTVRAGSTQTISLPTPAILSGTISDDGLPSKNVLTANWSVVSGPGTVAFGNANFPATTASFSAPGTYVLDLTASDGMLSSSATVTITVNAAVVVITSVTPNTGQQGQVNLSVSIAGKNTNFVQGTTAASFGIGVTVVSLTVASPTSATAVINIASTAPVGTQTVTVTTGTEIVTLASGFNIVAGAGSGNQAPVVSANAGCSSTISILPSQMTFAEYASSHVGTNFYDMTAGPDCNLWFAESGLNIISRISPAGVFTDFSIPTASSFPLSIVPGPDGNLWFTEADAGNIGRITPAGVITEFPVNTASRPIRIVSGPDGNLWFTDEGTNAIGRMTTSGVVTEFIVPTANANPNTPAVGPDGAIWFTETSSTLPGYPPAAIGRVTTTGQFTEFPIPTPSGAPVGITVGPDKNLWFTEEVANQIGRITPSGVVTEFPIPTAGGYPGGITAGPDGNLWFAEVHGNKIGRITTAGVITEFPLPSGVSVPNWIVSGPEGDLWFDVAVNGNYGVGSLNPLTSVAVAGLSGTVTDDGLPVGASLTTIWNLVSGPGPVTFSTPTATFPDVAGQVNSTSTEATFTVPGTYVLSLTAPDSQLTGSANVSITVNPPPGSSLVSVSPNSGQQGQQNLSVILTGQNTSWVQGATVASFGPGILVASLTVSSPTSATAVVDISSTAATASQTVTMTTGSEVETLANGFSVLASPIASLSSVSPNSGQQGQQNLSVSLVGQNTHFTNASVIDFGAGITVSNVSATDFTHLLAQLTIAGGAATGARSLSVTTGTEAESLSNSFTVTPGAPVILIVNPNQVSQCSVNLDFNADGVLPSASDGFQYLTGTNLGLPTFFAPEAAVFSVSNGLLHLNTAALGPNVGYADYTRNGLFDPTKDLLIETRLAIYSDSTGEFAIGALAQDLTFAGITFESGQMYFLKDPPPSPQFPVPDTGFHTYRISYTAATKQYKVFLDGVQLGGSQSLTYTGAASNSGGTLTFGDHSGFLGFNVRADIDYIHLQNCGQTPVTITGQFTHFVQGTTAASFGAGVNVTSLTVNSPTGATATLGIDPAASEGPRTVTLTTGSEVASLVNGFAVSLLTGPSITTSPNSGVQGQQNLSVAITGQNTHFAQGTTQVSFVGAAIAVGTVTVASATNLTAQISIDPSAKTGTYTVAVTTGGETVSWVFTVIAAGSPILLSVNPNTGQQGQQNLSINITGQNTNFVQGTTTATFGAGITLASLTVNSATSAMAVLNIDPAAALGARTVTLTTGAEVVSLASGFMVSAPSPAITTVSPNAGPQGQGGPVGIVGLNTHFVQGTTQVSFGPGIAVSNINVTCPTCLTVQLQISPTTVPGPVTVTVTTGSEVASLANGFTILPGTPILTSLVPASAQQGRQNVLLTITGQFTHFAQGGTTQVSLGNGVTVNTISVISATNLTAQVSIDPAAAVGTRTLTVTTGSEIVSVANVFTVTAGTPIVLSLNPGDGQQGQSALSVAITGLNTHFVQGTSQVSFGSGVTVTLLTVSSPTTATAVVNIDPAATIGTRTVTVATGTEVVSFNNGFTIVAGTPAILSLNPGGSQQGRQNLSVALVGQFTNWAQGTTIANFGSGVSVVSLTVSSSTAATAIVNIDPAAATGPRTVTMTTGSEVETFTNGFTVVAGTPVLLIANPSSGLQGQQALSVSITAQFTHFVQGTTTASFGANITIASLTVNTATNATAVLNIDPAAVIGARDVTLTTGTEVVTLTSGFTVTNGTAVLTLISPNAGQQGQQNLTVTVTGAFTHFAQGTSTASFGAGISVASVTVNSTTSATVVLNIDAAAVTGARNVTLTTGAEVVTLSAGFTVTSGTPLLSQVNPNSGQQGQQNLSVIVSGTFTHFVQGTTTANFGSGITVVSLTIGSATSATAVLDIDPTAAPGARNVTLSTGPEVVTLGSGFTVVQASSGPSIISLSPNSALQGQAIQVTITAQNTHFVQGTTQVNFGPQISVGAGPSDGYGPVQVTSPTTAIAQISVPNNAVLGLRTVVARTGSEQADIVNGFATTGAPYISSLSPSHAQPGQNISVTITGVFTNFQQGVTQANFGPGISVGGAASGGPGPVTVTSPSTATAQITIDSAATPGLRTPVTVTTGAEQATFVNSGFLVLGPVTGPGPIVSITSPTEGSEVTAPTTVTGTVTSPNLSNWTLEYEASGSTIFTQFASGTASTVSGTLDPTLLLNGIAQIRLTGVDQSGQTTSAIVDVVVTRNTKVGNFTLSFNDLTIPVAGIPIQIIRTYDSRNKSSGDFGFGWSLDIQTTKVDVNGVLGNNWTGTTTGGAFPTYCVQPNQNYVVSVRAPGGTVYQFAPTLNGGCQQLAPPSNVDMNFTPIGATPQNASLTAANSTGLAVIASFPGQAQLIDQSTAAPFDPDQFTLTLPTGQQLQVSETFGVQSIKDTNGNTLTITASGITSSAGKGVSFVRDAQKRITTITDPSGSILTYAYDANGDLVMFTDQLNNISTFAYDSLHNLLSFKDPRGIQPIRNVYDDSGRLIQQIDAFSHVINFTHDLGARTETITDFLGNPTSYVYDSDGNIISTTDALGNVTTATFDAHDNKLSETNALGKTSSYTYDANNNRLTETDPLSHTTTYTYNSRNEVLTITDAMSRVTTNTYDPNGNLLSTKDPAGNSTSYAYNGQGLRISMTDALGGISGYQYDGSGNLTQQTDPLGNVTSYTYDGNGNKLTQTRIRTTASGSETLITSYQYDGLNRLTATTYPDGSTTGIQYNAIGKQSVTTDQLGRQTGYQYDLMGRLTQTTFPDSTTETSPYDAQGNRIASTDRAGHTTTFVYDALKRLTGTTYADGATTATTYDGIGEVTAVADARGNQTKYQYDGAGRRTSAIDPLSHATSFTYDSVGNQTSMTDANGNTTQYQYDALNRRTKTVYSDNTSDGVAYDALGRTVSKTDQAGQVTQFQFDKLGRLTQVTDALSQVTKHAYDEVGNRISQTDANSHTTTFAYDKLGRRTKRTLPLGMFETLTYDVAGNPVSKTDFNGKITSYSYDLLNRLTGKTPDASFAAPAISFAYTFTGQRQTMTDANGTTNYSYDQRDRLTQKASPQGTVSYAYDLAGNLTSIQSSNAGGNSVVYSYDALNRLSTVQDNRSASGTTTYSYDNVGNLQGYAYPNGVQTAYSYNTLNRLTNVAISKGAPLASYAYQLGLAGNRTQVNELSGRQTSYSYDALYRLTGEAISGGTINGLIGYQYDPVGNRLQRTSTVAPIPSANYSYDANDRLGTDTYDADGNTTTSGGNVYSYDFENRLVNQNTGAVTVIYDGDGNRVAKTAGGVTTKYLVEDRNLTGYAQVLEETSGGTVQRVYTYGLNRISQSQASGTSFYGYDGHGSVRILTDATGAINDRYDYDAFGNIINQAGITPNVYLYSGEQNDPNLGLTYLRARYVNPDRGRFSTSDPLEGELDDPLSLNRYSYAEGDPADKIDPSGEQATIQETVEALTIDSVITQQFLQSLAANALLGKVVLEKVKGKSQQDEPLIAFQYMTTPKLVFVGLTGFVPTGYDKNCSKYIASNFCAFFTPDEYNSAIVAQDLLALPKRPAFRVELILYKKHDGVTPIPAAPVGREGPPDRPFLMPGGGLEFVTPAPVPFWTRRLDVTAIH